MAYDERRNRVAGRYENRNCSEMFYPKGVVRGQPFFDHGHMGALHFPPRAKSEKSVITCPLCRSSQPDVRRYKDEKIYCVSCLKKRWFDHRPAADGTARCRWADCPTDVIAIIATYVSDYPDYARLCMVSTRWLEGCNGDVWRESEMTKRVRWLLWKELALRRSRAAGSFPFTRAGEFAARLEFADLAGEFVETNVSLERQLRLVHLMGTTAYVMVFAGAKEPLTSRNFTAAHFDFPSQSLRVQLVESDSTLFDFCEKKDSHFVLSTASGYVLTVDAATGFVVSCKKRGLLSARQKKLCPCLVA